MFISTLVFFQARFYLTISFAFQLLDTGSGNDVVNFLFLPFTLIDNLLENINLLEFTL